MANKGYDVSVSALSYTPTVESLKFTFRRCEENEIMRVLIMSDMEGVSGIVVWEQVSGGAAMFEEGRELYTEEINAAVRGAKAAGATEVVVVDCHGAGQCWSFNSLIPDKLHPDCEWVAPSRVGALRRNVETRMRRMSADRHARPRRYPRRGAVSHHLQRPVSKSLVQRRSRRGNRRQCRAQRALRGADCPRHRR